MDTARRPVGLIAARPIYSLAQEVSKLWREVDPAAQPYLERMRLMERIHDNVDDHPGRETIQGFLDNSTSWTGPDASRIKAELRGKL